MTVIVQSNKCLSAVGVGLMCLVMLCLGATQTKAKINDALWLTLAPVASSKEVVCDEHQAPSSPASSRNTENKTTRRKTAPKAVAADTTTRGGPSAQKAERGNKYQAKRTGGRPGRPAGTAKFESEHRAIPVRTYYLKGPALSVQAEAYLLHPDGSSEEIVLPRDSQGRVTYNTPLKDDRLHGANNLYVVDRQVKDKVLTVRVAKWMTIHHSCGWGHDYRNTPARIEPLSLATIPLEIVIDDLWDGNFHVRTQSGDTLNAKVLLHGKPLKGAEVTITTDKKWSHRSITTDKGIAPVQLIRDYYPPTWGSFKRAKRGRMTVMAQHRAELAGEYMGQPYERVHFISTLPWKYTPASSDYTSYAFGLAIGTLALSVAGIGVYGYRERRKRPYRGINLDE